MDEKELVEHYEIENRGSCLFRSRITLQVNQLEDDEDIRNLGHKNGAFAELACAYFLEKERNERILDLEAWNKSCLADVKSYLEAENAEFFTQVKYLGEIPEVIKLGLKAQRSVTGTAVASISPVGKIYNYMALRITDAVIQFEDRNIDHKKRRVFVVVDSAIDRNNIFSTYLSNEENWFEGDDWNSLLSELKLNNAQKKYIERPFKHYLSRLNKLILARRDDKWNLTIYYQNEPMNEHDF